MMCKSQSAAEGLVDSLAAASIKGRREVDQNGASWIKISVLQDSGMALIASRYLVVFGKAFSRLKSCSFLLLSSKFPASEAGLGKVASIRYSNSMINPFVTCTM